MVCLSQPQSVEKDFLSLVQESFPLVPRPFAKIGEKIGISESGAIDMYKRLKEQKIIRQTSAILDTKKLGYDSSLVAFAMDESEIEEAASFISTHPGVSHNYKREHEFNLWFTIAVPPDSALGLKSTVDLMAKKLGAKKAMVLPTLKMFKISVKLDVNKTKETKEKVAKKEIEHILLTPSHYRVIAAIQEDLSAVSEPFCEVADRLHMDYDEFFGVINDLSRGGYMRRYATILNHRQAGFTANAMLVWDIEDEISEENGIKAAEFSAVSHCYLRPRYEGWNYNLFTMIHASSTDEMSNTISQMRSELAAKDYRILTSILEYKKVRIKYFTQDTYEWENKFLLGGQNG